MKTHCFQSNLYWTFFEKVGRGERIYFFLEVVLFDKIKRMINGPEYFGYEKGTFTLKKPFSGEQLNKNNAKL